MVDGLKFLFVTILIVGCGIGLSSCRENEQGRPLNKQKGVYEGPADEKLDPRHVETLRSRAMGQKF
ncbi:MAG: hypothetical protein ACR2Q4_23725 [Geminicoccaceae bacterium]